MGNTQGMPIFNDDELNHLSAADREKLKQAALEEIRNNQDIRDLLKTKPEIFKETREVRGIVRREMKKKFNIP
jgi:hypothetical protein